MDRKRRRELALAGGAVLLVAIATWALQRGAAAPDASAPAGTAARDEPALATEDAGHRSRSERAGSGTSRARREHQKSVPIQAESRRRPPSAETIKQREQQAAAVAQAASGPVEPPPPPRIPLEVHRRHDGSGEPGKADRDSERCARHVLRPRRRSRGRAVSDREDRRRINRACVSRRTRAPNHQTNRTIKRDMRRLTSVFALVFSIALLTGCATSRAFSRGEERARVGDWDSAVTYFRTAVQADPDRAEYRIALERAMLNASRLHFDNARALEAKDQLDGALLEYRRTVEYDPGNTQALDRIVQLEKIIRDRIEASRPKPAIAQLREQARQVSPAPLLNPGVARAAGLQLQAGEPARHPDVHRQRDRHQRHLRHELQRSACDGDAPGIDRTGAQHAAVVERAVLYGSRRAHDRRRAGLGAEPPEVRTAGGPDDSAVLRRRDRACGDVDGHHAHDDRRHDSTGHHPEQDEQLHYRARDASRWWPSSASWCSPTTSREPRSRSTSRFSK